MKRILVTGGAGFLGSHLVDALVCRGSRITVLDDLSHGSMDNLAQHQGNPLVSVIIGDVQDSKVVDTAARGCEHIVHLAARKIPRYGHRLDTLRVNANGTANVLAAAHRYGATVLFASTSDCFGLNPDVPFGEMAQTVFGPSTVARWAYAASKLYGEHLCWAYQEEHALPVTVLRYFNLYGPREHRSWWGGAQAVFIEAILDGRAAELHGDGRQARTFCYVSDAIAGTLAALDSPGAVGEMINVGGSTEVTITELAALIHRLIGQPEPLQLSLVPYYAISSRPYQDSPRRRADVTKARDLLGFAAKVGLEDGLRKTIEWHRAARADNQIPIGSSYES